MWIDDMGQNYHRWTYSPTYYLVCHFDTQRYSDKIRESHVAPYVVDIGDFITLIYSNVKPHIVELG